MLPWSNCRGDGISVVASNAIDGTDKTSIGLTDFVTPRLQRHGISLDDRMMRVKRKLHLYCHVLNAVALARSSEHHICVKIQILG